MKKILTIFLMLIMVLSLASCSKDDTSGNGGDTNINENQGNENQGNENQGNENQADLDKELDDAFANIVSGKKVYLTTAGQSDVDIVQSIMYLADETEEALVFYEFGSAVPTEGTIKIATDNMLTASNVEKGSVVFLVTGSSGKGLGYASTDVAGESARAAGFATAAEAGDITLIVLHVGGTARRGDQSDPVLNSVCGYADLLLVVNEGNGDKFFTNIASSNNVPLYLYSKSAEMTDAFIKMFGLE